MPTYITYSLSQCLVHHCFTLTFAANLFGLWDGIGILCTQNLEEVETGMLNSPVESPKSEHVPRPSLPLDKKASSVASSVQENPFNFDAQVLSELVLLAAGPVGRQIYADDDRWCRWWLWSFDPSSIILCSRCVLQFQHRTEVKKWLVRGLVKFLLAVPWLCCLALPGSFLNVFYKPFFRAL